MKLVTFEPRDAPPRIGARVDGDRLIDFAAAQAGAVPAYFTSMVALIEGGETAWAQARALVADPPEAAVLSVDAVRLLAPIPVPPQLRDFLSFELHFSQAMESIGRIRAAAAPDPDAAFAQMKASGKLGIPDVWYRQPVYYKGNRFAVSGPGDDVVWPDYSKIMDYELELAAVIGRTGKDIARDQAHTFIFGYTILNDFSARDAQGIEMEGMLGPAKGKDFDGANAMGPCLVTADEIGDPYDLTMVARVNGAEWSRGNSATMHWTFADMIAHVSRSETLYPGEVLGSGTVGNGCGLEHMKFLEDGDTVELEIDKIGVLKNRVVRA